MITRRKDPTPIDRLRRWSARSFATRINREPSPVLARTVPWASIILASLIPAWFIIASAPVLPPLGFLVMLAWRQLRPGVLPIWSGAPLGLFDDLVSGQPVGSAVLLWSATMIVTDLIEARVPWRNFAMEWLVAAGIIGAYALFGAALANAAGAATPLIVVIPQIALGILVYPVVARGVARLDQFRLLPVKDASG